jgi:hypothetical protein
MKEVTYVHDQTARLYQSFYRCDDDGAGCTRRGHFSQPTTWGWYRHRRPCSRREIKRNLGQPIVVDNRGGAGGVLGTEIVAKAVPDGYTLLLVPTRHVINPSIYAKLPYDTAKDFAPITMVASDHILMAVNPRVPAETVGSFVEAAKANPKAIGNYGSAGVGTVFHLTGQLFNQLSGLSLQHVPYRGGTDGDRFACRRDTARAAPKLTLSGSAHSRP